MEDNCAHTPEPWQYSFPKINGQEFRETDCQISTGAFLIANVSHGPIFPVEPFGSQTREANARRIVACVNACAGIPTEQLELSASFGAQTGEMMTLEAARSNARVWQAYLMKARQQRDELLYQLEEMTAIVRQNTYPQPDKPNSTWGSLVEAEAVINKIKGGAA